MRESKTLVALDRPQMARATRRIPMTSSRKEQRGRVSLLHGSPLSRPFSLEPGCSNP